MSKVALGTKIIGDFGAMIPLWEGKVVNIKTYDVGPSTPEITIKWDNGSKTHILATEIDSAPTVNGSPIGYYTEKVYYGCLCN